MAKKDILPWFLGKFGVYRNEKPANLRQVIPKRKYTDKKNYIRWVKLKIDVLWQQFS